ncbi:MAG: POTRA domain-containing protein [Silvanigrellaceae bacterium]
MKHLPFSAILLLCCLVLNSAAQGNVPAPIQSDSRRLTLGAIQLVGLVRTTEEFVFREIGLEPGQIVSEAEVEAVAQRLRNTNFFVSVEVALEAGTEGRTNLRFDFREKWTLTPVLRGGTGGGVEFLVAGLYDLNLLGRGIEAGLQYEQYAGEPGVNLWWRQPNFLSTAWKSGVEVQVGNRPFFYLDPGTRNYFTPLAMVSRVSLTTQRRFQSFDLGVNVEFLERGLDSTVIQSSVEYDQFDRRIETGMQSKIYFRWNRLNLYDFLWEGHRLEVNIGNLFPEPGSGLSNIQSASFSGTHFFRVLESHNVGFRFQGNWTNGSSLLSLLRLGSLDSVRAMDEGERIGRVAWTANAEERWVSYVDQNVVLQTVVFVDSGNAGKSFNEWPYPAAASAGLGLRLGLRPVARLRLRADYAHALAGLRKRQGWVVGMQHYF